MLIGLATSDPNATVQTAITALPMPLPVAEPYVEPTPTEQFSRGLKAAADLVTKPQVLGFLVIPAIALYLIFSGKKS